MSKIQNTKMTGIEKKIGKAEKRIRRVGKKIEEERRKYVSL